MFGEKTHRIVFIFGCTLLGIALPSSIFLMSVSQLLLAANWILEGNYSEKLRKITTPALGIFMSFYVAMLLGLIYTSNFEYALHDLRIKSPLFVLPLIIGTTKPITYKELKIILGCFVLSVFVCSIISTLTRFGLTRFDPVDVRNISRFISHIRFSLMVNISIYILIYFYVFRYKQLTQLERVFIPILFIWHIIFIILLQSFTGIVILIITLPLALLIVSIKIKWRGLSIGLSIILPLLCFISVLVLNRVHKNLFTPKILNDSLEVYTVNGNRYQHYRDSEVIENGYYVHRYVCEEELREAWNKRSNLDYDGIDKRNQPLKITLRRYMTSKELTKDSLGLSRMDDVDLDLVEKGHPNKIYRRKLSVFPRIYQTMWEIENYKQTKDPKNSTLFQRFEFQKSGLMVFRKNWLIGVGTGDINEEKDKAYRERNSKLPERLWFRPHNQYITILASFGLIGFTWFLISLISPVIIRKKYIDFLTLMFLMVAFLSMLNEDTLETHAGVSFVGFFYALFIFGRSKDENV